MAFFEYDVDLNNVISKSEIENILPHWKTKIKEVYQYKRDNLIEITICVAANSETEIQQWILAYEDKSKCSYSIRSTQTCSGTKVKFKQRLNCQHNTGNKNVYDPTNHKRTRNSDCPSSISVTLRTVRKKYFGRDKSKAADPSMPCEIRIIPHHNHSTSSADALRFRKVSNETREKLVNLFESGYSPANALESLKMDIQMKHDNFYELLADRSICSDYMYCYKLYMTIFKKKYGPIEASPDFLEKKINEFNKHINMKSAVIKFIDKDYVICLCPPLMQRVHETIEEASQIVFLDSKGIVDHSGHRIFILLTASNCGGLPLAVFITTSECAHSISVGFQLLKEIMGDRIFYGNIGGPILFMTDDSAAEHAAIKSEWPKSTNLLCIFHVLRSVWRWLMKTKNGIKQEHQNKLFQEFRIIMYAVNEQECKAAFQNALTGSEKYPNYQSYLNNYWDRRSLWALCYQNNSRQGHNTNNLSEAAMRLLKEKIFERIKAFNLIQVVDFMMTKFVSYYEKRLLDAAHNRTRRNILHRLISLPPSVDLIERIQHLTDSIHLVPSERESNLLYIVNTEVLTCTCNQGRKGNMCKHIDWICCFVQSDRFFETIDNDRTRRTLFFIATGNHPPRNWMEPSFGGSSSSAIIENKSTTNLTGNIEVSRGLSIENLEEAAADEEQYISKGSEAINDMSEIFSEYLKRSPLETSDALQVLLNGLKSIKTVSGFATACHTFSSGIINRRKNRRCKIPVQPTAISSRKTNRSRKPVFPKKELKNK